MTKNKNTVRFGQLVFLLVTLSQIFGRQDDDEFLYDTFPTNFKWGFGTAAYQIEGAYNLDGKGPSVLDVILHRIPSPIVDNSTGDVACDSYHKYPEDVQLLKNMGANFYRFSLSWSRILPTGKIDQINQLGIDYYNHLINLLIDNNIEPMITLHHYDLPLGLAKIDGSPTEEMVLAFEAYADLAFKTFGDRVKTWITFNEPFSFCTNVAPASMKIYVNGPYQCVHNVIKAHAKAYRLYENTYKSVQRGRVGITLHSRWYEPRDLSNSSHVQAAERALKFKHGWIGFPIFFGKYPDVMREFVDEKCSKEGVPSRLPEFTQEESDEIRGTWDFLGLNHYSTSLAEPTINNQAGWQWDHNLMTSDDPSWPSSASPLIKTVPWGFRKLLNWIKNTYNNPEIFVTENGFPDYPETGLKDTGRVNYHINYINQMLKAIKLDGVNCSSYTAWSLIDNYQWMYGYTQRFGVHQVDFTDPSRSRTPKMSAGVLKKIFADNGFPKL